MEDKIEQYCLLAKGARGRALTDLIHKATAEPGLFAFSELLEVESVKELESSELASSYQLLKLFAYGTWRDYSANTIMYPDLDGRQKMKLKQLTIVSIAEQHKVIPYSHLMEQLHIKNVRELEDLLITECFYTQLVKGKLDQCQRCLHVHEVMARDVRMDDMDAVMSTLGEWLRTSESILSELESKVAYAAQKTADAEAHKSAIETKIEEVKRSFKNELESRGGASGSQDSMGMEDAGGTLSSLDYMDQDRGPISRPKRRR